jgi:type 1 glutamine amidotransferase
MSTIHAVWRISLIVFLTLVVIGQAHGQFPWQKPVKREPADIKRILGPMGEREPSRDLHIVWVWGIDKLHEKETHEYAWVMDRYVNALLPQVPRVTVTPSMYFPKEELWQRADLVVFYMWPRREGWDYDLIDAYQQRGGGLIVIHMALMQGSGEEWSKRIGMAWDLKRDGTKWGVLPTPVTLTEAAKESPIFERFPAKFDLADEFYWELRGDTSKITPLVTAPAGPAIANKPLPGPPKTEDLDGKPWPVMWTMQIGPGRVFVSTAGHNYFTFNDPYFRIILLRAMAWAMNESFDPFKPLVSADLER